MENCKGDTSSQGGNLSKTEPSSYRPISLLPAVGKLVERAVQVQLLEYMISSNQLNNFHHAYRKDHSTVTAIMKICDYIYEAVDENKIAGLMTIESSAFDCVDAIILDQKLGLYNVSQGTRSWIRDYLTNRTQYVQIGTKKSNMKSVARVVPQGSVLGPLLYTIYMNELMEIINDKECDMEEHDDKKELFTNECENCGMMPIYADDATYLIIDKSKNKIKDKMKENLKKISEFLNANDLVVNEEKTKIA